MSNKRTVTSLHGKFPLGTPVEVITRNGSMLSEHVELERFEVNTVDIAVILLRDECEFTHVIEWTNERVRLLHVLVDVGLTYGRVRDSVFPYAR